MRADGFVPNNTMSIYELKLCTYFAFRSIVSFIHITTYITLLVRGLPLVSWRVPISQDTSLCTALLQSPMQSCYSCQSILHVKGDHCVGDWLCYWHQTGSRVIELRAHVLGSHYGLQQSSSVIVTLLYSVHRY